METAQIFNELEDNAEKITQNAWRRNRKKNYKHKVRSSNIQLAKILKRDTKIMERFKDIIAENFPKWVRAIFLDLKVSWINK